MPNLLGLLARARDHLGPLLALAVVPFVLGALSLEKFRQVAASGADLRVGITFGFPSTVATSWDFLSLQNTAPGVNLPTRSLETAVLVLVVVAVLSALLGAGYLGSIRRELAGVDRAFLADARAYVGPFLGFKLLQLSFVLGALATGLVEPALVLVVLLALLAFGYLFYATPYLVVVEGVDLPTALGRCYGYATTSREYASFFVQYLLAAAAVSVVVTPPFTTSVPGAALGTLVLAPVCLLFNTATMLFVRDLTGATGRGRTTGPDDRSAGQSNIPVET